MPPCGDSLEMLACTSPSFSPFSPSSSTSASVEEGEEEEEWECACDQTTGNKYFWHPRTNEVRWLTEVEEEGKEEGKEEGWECVLDQNTGNEYFWHSVTDEVRWVEPPELAASRAE